MKKVSFLVWPVVVLALLLGTLLLVEKTSRAADDTPGVGGPESGTQLSGPPWYNTAWHYRRLVTISNSSVLLNNYQVLIKLTNSNFNFDRAKDNGSDVRITTNNGTTELDYWIESWNKPSRIAYIWVEVPSLGNGATTIYMYYNYLGAITTTSNGLLTFDFFDDVWSQFTGDGCAVNIPWECLDGTPIVSGGNLQLMTNTGIATHDKYHYTAVGYRANFGLGAGYEWGGFINGAGGQRTMITDLPTDVDDLYLRDYISDYDDILLSRVGIIDWHNSFHIYEIRWREGQSIGDIDHGASHVTSTLPAQVPSGTLPVTFYSWSGSNATLLVDWVYVRKYNNPEPAATLGTEQGLVDLGVIKDDSPDPLFAGEDLTYSITVSNNSSIAAPGVVMTDTLPAGVIFDSAIPSQGSCNSQVVCNLGQVAANSNASITLVVATTIDGDFTNTAIVGSPGYDPILSNNIAQEVTTVLPSADLSLTNQVNPDLVKPGSIITYTLSVANQGPSGALTVGVIDNLPVGVDFKDSIPDIYNCIESVEGEVSCTVGNLAASASAQILIVGQVTTNETVYLDSNASVSSAIYDPNPTNDEDQAQILVDAEKPVVTWISPIGNEGIFPTPFTASMIPLSALVTEQYSGVDRAEFFYWDHLHDNQDGTYGWYVNIATDTTSPYQTELNSGVLKPGELYQIFVRAYDRAGNLSERKRIIIERLPYNIYMPITKK